MAHGIIYFWANARLSIKVIPILIYIEIRLGCVLYRSASTGSNNSPDRHSRTSSSPAAVVTSSAYSSPELGHNHYLHHHQHQHQHQHHNNGNHSLLSLSSSLSPNRSTRSTRSSAESYHQQPQPQQQQPLAPQPHQQRAEPQQPLEEEVIFF